MYERNLTVVDTFDFLFQMSSIHLVFALPIALYGSLLAVNISQASPYVTIVAFFLIFQTGRRSR